MLIPPAMIIQRIIEWFHVEFERIILDHRSAPATQIADAVVQAVDGFSDSEEPFDDLAVIVVKRT